MIFLFNCQTFSNNKALDDLVRLRSFFPDMSISFRVSIHFVVFFLCFLRMLETLDGFRIRRFVLSIFTGLGCRTSSMADSWIKQKTKEK